MLPTVDPHERCAWIYRRLRARRRYGVAGLAVFAAGAVLAGAHWWRPPWLRWTAELHATWVAAPPPPGVDYPAALGLLLLGAGGLLGGAVFAGAFSRRLAHAAAAILAGLAGAHVLKDWLGLQVAAADAGDRNGWQIAVQGVAFLLVALTPPTVAVAAAGAGTAALRLVSRPRRPAADGPPAPSDAAGDDANWCEGYALPPARRGAGPPYGLGICLSGGGIRSATFALGALQALQARPSLAPGEGRSELTRARYLAAVSGGAYTAGALLLAVEPPRVPAPTPPGMPWWRLLAPAPTAPDPTYDLDFDRAFRPGSPEFDHLRRHSSYLADGLREWVVAVLVVLRGAAIATLCLSLLALVAGRWIGHFYHQVGRASLLDQPWEPVWGAAFVALGVALLAAGAWILSLATWRPARIGPWLDEAAFVLSVALGLLLLPGAAIPLVTWASATLLPEATGAAQVTAGAAKGAALGVAGVLTTVLGLLGRQRTALLATLRTGGTTLLQRLGDTGRRLLQWGAILAGLGMVLAVYLAIFGYATWATAHADPGRRSTISWGGPDWRLPVTDFGATVALTAVLLALYFLVDETATGLHPFYRRRLASAFAVRRVRDPRSPYGFTARPYPPKETTDLHAYDGRHLAAGRPPGPQVIFCASAHCTDPEFTPPGRHVLPFTFSRDYIGGPEVGWYDLGARPAPGTVRVTPRLLKDLTVQTAMAVSGAAFASARGSGRVPANIVLALTNARLGTWLPTPALPGAAAPQWWQARPPRWRRMSYLVREIFGWHPRDFPLLFVTDGAHYEGLGLVELLRHRCREIYCFDASSDAETFARALAQSITLAYDELGVTVTLDEPSRAEPGGGPGAAGGTAGAADGPAGDGAAAGADDATSATTAESGAGAARLAARLADTPLITGRVTYPAAAGDAPPRERVGTLIIGRAVLSPDLPWEVLQHAAAHPLFPQDATGDQWFDDKKFNAYTGLGRFVGARAADAMAARRGDRPLAAWAVAAAACGWLDDAAPRDGTAPGANDDARPLVAAHRRLAAVQSDDRLPALAAWLDRAAAALTARSRPEQALVAAEEATDLYRRLAADHPDTHLPNLAGALDRQAARLAGVGAARRAAPVSAESVALFRGLADRRPEAFAPGLAAALRRYALLLTAQERTADAVAAADEAVARYVRLAARWPRYRDDLDEARDILAAVTGHAPAASAADRAALR